MQYANDLATAVMCHKALLYIFEKMSELKTSYPELNKAMMLATDGFARSISVECEKCKDGTCVITTEDVGGIPEILAQLESAIEWLTLELHLEGVNSDEGGREAGTGPSDGDSRGDNQPLHPTEG